MDTISSCTERAMTVAELKAHFSDVIEMVKNGERVKVLYGKAKKPVAMMAPIDDRSPRKLGLMEKLAEFKEEGNGKISEEEFFGL